MRAPRRIPSWLLVVATAAICAVTLQLERENLFPLWQLATRWSPRALPSTAAVPRLEVVSGLPILSLAIDESDLNDPEKGLLPNKLQHGPDWERPASLSYFEGGRLLFASGVGARIHGGGSRIVAPRLGFRLYFRRRYGPREFAPGILFGPDAQPIRRLVVHDDVRRDSDGTLWYFANPLAYDIARAMGAIAPETKPVRFFVNGEYYGPFVLTERFDERYFAAHWGYDDILLDQAAFDELWGWVSQTRPLTMKAVAQQVDLENLTRWFLAVAFCATRDAYQGPGQRLDLTRPQGGWFWVNWDMDQSFRSWDLDSYEYLLERIAEPGPGRNRAEPRPTLLTHLIAEDAEYREHFKRVFQRVMNHQVTDAFLTERYLHYVDEATKLRVEQLDYLPRLREFLERRPVFFRQITEQWLNTAPSQPVTLVAPGDVSLTIDGERVKAGYRGFYFPDLEVVVDVPAEHRAQFVGWRVNGGSTVGTPTLAFTADRPTRVEALFGAAKAADPAVVAGPFPREPDVVPRGREDLVSSGPPSAALRPVSWRPIPAGSFHMGCVPGDTRCGPAEMPRVQVRIDAPFDVMDREVAAAEFQAYAAASGRQMPRQPEWRADGTHPVVNVTWDEAQAYCSWIGGRLPTEEQWEYAARGRLDGRLFPWGDTFQGQANALLTVPTETWQYTAPVGSFPPNGFGLHDMAGNVWEWTASLHRPTHDTGPASDGYDLRTIKGGSWNNTPLRLRLSDRSALSRRGRHNIYVGFRCVKEG